MLKLLPPEPTKAQLQALAASRTKFTTPARKALSTLMHDQLRRELSA